MVNNKINFIEKITTSGEYIFSTQVVKANL